MNRIIPKSSNDALLKKITPSLAERLKEIALVSLHSAVNRSKEPMVPDSELLEEKAGVFVTLKENGDLRGCIGFMAPVYPLKDAVKRATALAASSDPRFRPVAENELNKIEIEITVLGEPEELSISKESDLNQIAIGEDGLIVVNGRGTGILLPQVAEEWNFTSREFLEATCEKAGLSKDSWKDSITRVYKFKAKII